MLASEAMQSEASPTSTAAVELDSIAPQAELTTPALPNRELSSSATKSGARKRVGLLIAASALAGALVGTGAWVRSHRAATAAPRAVTAPTAITLATATPTNAPPPADAQPTAVAAPAAAEAPAPSASAIPEASAAPPSAASAASVPLLAVDGSERPAPTCDDLLANVSSEGEKAFDHVRIGRQALVRGDVDGSQRGFCRAIRAGQTDALVTSELAQVLILRRDAAAAVPWAQKTVSQDPRSSRALTLLGDALVRTGNLDEARKAWLAASKLSENDRAAIDGLAQAALVAADSALKERDPARAERLLRKVIAFQPENAIAHVKLGVALTRLGFAQSAAAWTKRAVELSAAK